MHNKALTKKTQKKPPYHFGRFWPLFQLFKNGSKTKVNPFRMILRHYQRGFRPFEPFLKS